MPFFKNQGDQTVTMSLQDGKPPVVVDPGAIVEVRDPWAQYVRSRGYRLLEVDSMAGDAPEPPAFDLDAYLARVDAAATPSELDAISTEIVAIADTIPAAAQRKLRLAGEKKTAALAKK